MWKISLFLVSIDHIQSGYLRRKVQQYLVDKENKIKYKKTDFKG